MKNKLESPLYSKIALDIAIRIVRGDLKENSKLSGRSLIAGEYNVSPETIRKSFQLLEDMGIVEVLQSRGVIIISREKASKYIEKYNIGKDFRSLKQELKELMNERDNINNRIINLMDQILDINERYRNMNPLFTLDFVIPPNSLVIGKSINEINFWHNTGATIVAVKRMEKMILSPGPYFIFEPNDIIIVTGDLAISKRIESVLND